MKAVKKMAAWAKTGSISLDWVVKSLKSLSKVQIILALLVFVYFVLADILMQVSSSMIFNREAFASGQR